MNRDLENIKISIEQSNILSASEKESLMNSIKSVDKELTIIEFKLERTEKVKRTTSVLLEETINELEKKRADVEQANTALTKSLEELKATQQQLIQSEKMASLGELTAGIAHEIQNPLNFVKNFSEVNTELLEELKAERLKRKGERDEKLEEEILKDISENEKKIVGHGNRADAIVKGMLQHSQTSTGQKEPTDLNALANEYLRLAYHGLRAKDKNFNADFKTDFDTSLPKVNVIPQDMGRVLLNLINNAFFAVNEKASKAGRGQVPEVLEGQGGQIYKPLVTITTKNLSDKIEISVKDNGIGISEQIREKIFQPFFTTKPTGSGTGLGLSLSYDIVKAHGGEFEVETIQGEGTKFIVKLPGA